MPKEKLTKLTEAQVRALANAKSFARGKSYYQDGALIAPLLQGSELRAECEGSEYQPYQNQISVTLDANGIAETSCTMMMAISPSSLMALPQGWMNASLIAKLKRKYASMGLITADRYDLGNSCFCA